MTTFGQLCLLCTLVGSGYAAFACIVGWQRGHRAVGRSGDWAGAAGVLALTAAVGVLAWALLVKDFQFSYVSQYSNRLLPWYYSLSALWVGQAGSLLVWAWFLGVMALAYRFWPRQQASPLARPVFGILMAYVGFLAATMVFGADPMQPSLGTVQDGEGLSPLLQHPAMLLHPPVIFLGYAAWAIPFSLAVVALLSGRLDAGWVREARPWALFAWVVLGLGIILGGQWAYEELGWGGYWAWDPVENGSLIPWLTGTALIHALMAWQYRGSLKKTALWMAVATFALCNLATFLTRSGIFSSLHAFGQSPIGWMFLALVAAIAVGGGVLIVMRRKELASQRQIPGLWTREAMIVISTIALLLLAVVALTGTLMVPLSGIIFGRQIVVGMAFYNNVLIPTGLLLLATTAAAPLLQWGKAPNESQKRMLLVSIIVGGIAAAGAFAVGVRHPVGLAVAWLATSAAAAIIGAVILDSRAAMPSLLRNGRRQYAGFMIHMGFVCLAVGIAGSSLGTRRHDVVMAEGETIEWAGHRIRCAELIERQLPDKLVAEARLEITDGSSAFTLFPAQHLNLPQEEWTTEVAIRGSWSGDFYTILHGSQGEGRVALTFIDNPLVRWIWLGACIFGVGALIGLWPARRRSLPHPAIPAPKHRRRRQLVT